MPTYKNFTWVLVASGFMAVCAPVPAQSRPKVDRPEVTLDQAVEQVSRETGGKVLSAEPRSMGRRLEYRIKVLTPEGHVRVMAVSSEPAKKALNDPSTRHSPAPRGGHKENF